MDHSHFWSCIRWLHRFSDNAMMHVLYLDSQLLCTCLWICVVCIYLHFFLGLMRIHFLMWCNVIFSALLLLGVMACHSHSHTHTHAHCLESEQVCCMVSNNVNILFCDFYSLASFWQQLHNNKSMSSNSPLLCLFKKVEEVWIRNGWGCAYMCYLLQILWSATMVYICVNRLYFAQVITEWRNQSWLFSVL